MTSGDDIPTSDARPTPVRPLDYPAPHLSTLDRPVEPIVHAARTVRLAVRITWIVVAVVFLLFALWALRQLSEAFEAVGGP